MEKNNNQELRKIIQYSFLVVTLIIVVLLINGILCSAHGFCPFSSVCFGVLSLNPVVAKLLYPIAAVIGLFIAITSIFVGRRFCSYVCPFGTVQEVIFNLNPGKKKNKQNNLPTNLHKLLSGLKYILLGITVLASIKTVQYIYMKFCPVLAVSHPQNITLYSVITLFVIFGIGFLINHFWCRYLCPYAALMNIFQYFGRILDIPSKKLQINENSCIKCRLCSMYCPMQIEIHQTKRVDDVNCTFCLKCQNICPDDMGIILKRPQKRKKLD
ncbi:MAG: 4Fe-4S binding protein [Candidatus Cloacimonetes bacterium]|nr:4Fe-4S binding protein [Candidatus Cloacimonadota bacterium]